MTRNSPLTTHHSPLLLLCLLTAAYCQAAEPATITASPEAAQAVAVEVVRLVQADAWTMVPKPGGYWLVVSAGGVTTTYTIHTGDGPIPPPPPPPPPPPGELTAVVVIEETADRSKLTPSQIELLLSKSWRTWCDDRKIQWRLTDDDVTDQSGTVPTDLAPSIKAARTHGLPAVVFLDADGKVIGVEAWPDNEAAIIEMLEAKR